MNISKIKQHMHSYGSVPRNTLVLYVTHIITSLVSLVFFGILARYLGVRNFGMFSYVYAFMTIAQTAGAFGLDMLMIREISSDRENAMSTAGNTLVLKFIFSACTLLIVLVLVSFSGFNVDAETKKILILFSPYILLSNVNLTLWYIGDGYQKMEYRGIFTVAYYCCRTIGGWLVLKYIHGIAALFVFLLSVELLFAVASFFFAGLYFGGIKFAFRMKALKHAVRLSFPFAVSSLLLIFLLRIDILLLNSLKGEEAVGLYSPAQKLTGLLLLFSSAFCSSAYPAMSQSLRMNSDKGYELFFRAVKLMFAAGVIFACFTTLLAEPVIKIVFGSEYIGSAGALKILVWMCPPFFAVSLFFVLFAVKNFQHLVTIIYSFGIFISFGLNYYLIQRMSYLGSALAIVIFSLFLLIITVVFYYANKKKMFNLQ